MSNEARAMSIFQMKEFGMDIQDMLHPIDSLLESGEKIPMNPLGESIVMPEAVIDDQKVLAKIMEEQLYSGASEDLPVIFGSDTMTLETYGEREYLTGLSVRPSPDGNTIRVYSGIFPCNGTGLSMKTVDLTNDITRRHMMNAGQEIKFLKSQNSELFDKNPKIEVVRIASSGEIGWVQSAVALGMRARGLDNTVIYAVEKANEAHKLNMVSGETYNLKPGSEPLTDRDIRSIRTLMSIMDKSLRGLYDHDPLDLVPVIDMLGVIEDHNLQNATFSRGGRLLEAMVSDQY